MRLGYCTNMEATDPWGVGYDHITEAKSLGLDYVEMPLAQMAQMPGPEFEAQILRRLDKAGIPCYSCNNLFPATLRLTGPEVSADAIRAYAETAFSLANRLGAKVIVFGSSGARNLPAGWSLEQGYGQLADTLSIIAPLAVRYGMRIALEPLNRMESNILNSYQSGLFLAALCGQPNVGTLVDLYHFAVGNETLESLLIRRPTHVHLAQAQGRLLPRQPADSTFISFLATLQASGYQEAISLEGYTEGGTREHLRESLALLRSIRLPEA